MSLRRLIIQNSNYYAVVWYMVALIHRSKKKTAFSQRKGLLSSLLTKRNNKTGLTFQTFSSGQTCKCGPNFNTLPPLESNIKSNIDWVIQSFAMLDSSAVCFQFYISYNLGKCINFGLHSVRSERVNSVSQSHHYSPSLLLWGSNHWPFNPLRPNSDGIRTSHSNIMDLLVSQVMRIENMITQVKFYWYFNSFSPVLL